MLYIKVQLGTASKEVAVPVYAADKNVMTVYPNPVSDVLNIALSGEVNANTSFVMMDAKGVVVMQQKFVHNPQAVDISKLTSGVYLVKINNGGKVVTEKFIKQ